MPDQQPAAHDDQARRFPILEAGRPKGVNSVPWSFAARVYEDYAYLYGHSQSLERLAQRGGFGWVEMLSIMVDAAERRWKGAVGASPDEVTEP